MDRESFLNRVAERLGRPRLQSAPARDVVGVPDFYRDAPADEDLAGRFASELEAVGGEAVLADSLTAVHAALDEVLARFQAASVVTWARSELRAYELERFWARGMKAAGDEGLADDVTLRASLLDADVGITGVDFAVASTGSLVVTAAPGRPRGVSLLPALHVALVKESQLVWRVGEALAAFAGRGHRGAPSAVHFITGPSRTSDIENDLTIGVHGPAAVVAIVWRGA